MTLKNDTFISLALHGLICEVAKIAEANWIILAASPNIFSAVACFVFLICAGNSRGQTRGANRGANKLAEVTV